jgi:hypothetical protein
LHPILDIKEPLTDFHGDEAFSFNILKKRSKMADSKKTEFFKIADTQNSLAKILEIGPWIIVELIDAKILILIYAYLIFSAMPFANVYGD